MKVAVPNGRTCDWMRDAGSRPSRGLLVPQTRGQAHSHTRPTFPETSFETTSHNQHRYSESRIKDVNMAEIVGLVSAIAAIAGASVKIARAVLSACDDFGVVTSSVKAIAEDMRFVTIILR